MSPASAHCDLAVIGGGAAGLAAAIFAAEHAGERGPLRIVVLDGAPRIGAKILIAGGGRCNVTHTVVGAEDFNGARTIVRNVLAAFDAAATVRWFERLGVPLKREETGKLFPVSDRAQTVVDGLLARAATLGVEIRTGHRVDDLTADAADETWTVRHARGDLVARAVVVATGGRSLPRTGSDGSGYALVARLGHEVTTTVPALVPLVLAAGFHRDLSGVAHPVELRTVVDGKLADRRTGSLLWTHFGASGPVVLDASRHWTTARAAGRSAVVRCSFLPGEDFTAVERRLLAAAGAHPRASVARALAGTLPERVAEMLVRTAGLDPAGRLADLTRAARRALGHTLADLELPVARERGWDFAEVTAGGVPLDEIDFRTMESRRRAGLHLVGEILDCDGRIGGFNFQWAWATGYLAGRAVAARALENPHQFR